MKEEIKSELLWEWLKAKRHLHNAFLVVNYLLYATGLRA